jgi:tripartite-type tricarboxylate transporter receptor subunit TctC
MAYSGWFKRAAVMLIVSIPGISHAQAPQYPTKPVRIVFPFAAGGAGDIIARTYGQKFSEKFGQPWVLENRAGAGSTIGADAVAKAPADGYTLLLGTLTFAVSAATYRKLPYDPVKDFSPIAPVGMAVSLLAATPSLEAKSVKELIALAKAQPGKLTFASAGQGSTGHLSGELFMRMAGIEMLHVPYQGTGAAINDLFGGRTQMIFEPMATMYPHVKAGKMRALAVTTAKRSLAAPEVPTLVEQGLPGYDVATWYGIMGPAGMQQSVVDRLNTALVEFVANAEVKEKMASLGVEPLSMTPAEFSQRIRIDINRWSEVAKSANVSF